YNKMWHQTQEALNSLLDKESQKMMEPQRNQVFIFQMLATFYIKYVQIFRNLENVYDQIVHPQKRILIRKILDAVMGRILELKNEMVELELTEFHYFDDILQDLKLAPQQLDIPIPKYFLKEKLEIIKGREKILSQILAESELGVSAKKYQVKPMPLEEAVKLIQIAERARQGRLRAMFMKQIYLQEYRAKQARLLGDKVADAGAAALRIQKNPPPLLNEVSTAIIQADRLSHLRNKVQIKHEEEYRDALVTIKDDLKLTEGLDIKENLQDQIRHWFIECRVVMSPRAVEADTPLVFIDGQEERGTREDEMSLRVPPHHKCPIFLPLMPSDCRANNFLLFSEDFREQIFLFVHFFLTLGPGIEPVSPALAGRPKKIKSLTVSHLFYDLEQLENLLVFLLVVFLLLLKLMSFESVMPSNHLILCRPLCLLPSIFPITFFIVQLSHPYVTRGKTIALTRWVFVGKVMSLLFNMLSRLVIALKIKIDFKCSKICPLGSIRSDGKEAGLWGLEVIFILRVVFPGVRDSREAIHTRVPWFQRAYCTPNAGAMGSSPARGTKSPHATYSLNPPASGNCLEVSSHRHDRL
ncbi:hypothetical protein FD754_010208, partial [Muntiacus muntjak]